MAGDGVGGGGKGVEVWRCEGIPVDSAQNVNSREDNYGVSPAESATFRRRVRGCHLTIIRSLTCLTPTCLRGGTDEKQRSQGSGEGLDLTALPAPE